MDAVFTTEKLAERYSRTPGAVRLWRYRGKGPPYFRQGKRVYYREAAVIKWEKSEEAAEMAKVS